MKKDNSKITAIILAILAIIVVSLSLIFNKQDKPNTNIHILKDPSEFFTVNSCLYRVTTYIYNKDVKSLLKVLDLNYKRDNKINSQNILDKFANIDFDATFVSKKMYYEKISDDITKYYVYGQIEPNVIHDYNIVENNGNIDAYYIVYLNSKKQVFSITPYDGNLFLDGETNE